MNKNVVEVDEYAIKCEVERGVCPIDWLAKFYNVDSGKLVMIDDELLLFLLNKSKRDRVVVKQSEDGYQKDFEIIWDATDLFPETKLVVSSYGQGKIFEAFAEDESNSGRSWRISNYGQNWNIITTLQASDVIEEGREYAEQATEDKQMIFLVAKHHYQECEQLNIGEKDKILPSYIHLGSWDEERCQ